MDQWHTGNNDQAATNQPPTQHATPGGANGRRQQDFPETMQYEQYQAHHTPPAPTPAALTPQAENLETQVFPPQPGPQYSAQFHPQQQPQYGPQYQAAQVPHYGVPPASHAVPRKNNTGVWLISGLAIFGVIGLAFVVMLAGAVMGSSQNSTVASSERVPKTQAPDADKNRPAPRPLPPQDRTVNESSVTSAQEKEIERAIQNTFPRAIGQALLMDTCDETEFTLDPTYRQLECAFPSPVRPGKLEYAGIITDQAALDSLLNNYEFPDWQYVRSAPDHDFHLIAEVFNDDFGYATYAFDLQPSGIATTYIIFTDERTASDYFVEVGLAQPTERTS